MIYDNIVACGIFVDTETRRDTPGHPTRILRLIDQSESSSRRVIVTDILQECHNTSLALPLLAQLPGGRSNLHCRCNIHVHWCVIRQVRLPPSTWRSSASASQHSTSELAQSQSIIGIAHNRHVFDALNNILSPRGTHQANVAFQWQP